MDTDTRNKIIGFTGGALIVISLIPQLVKIFINKSSKNVSIVTYWILLVAQSLWALYGILNRDLQVAVTNVTAGTLTILIILTAYSFRG